MNSNECIILFDKNEHGTYFTGQVVTGKVIVTFVKPKKLKGIKLQICGYAACQWREKRGKKKPKPHLKKRRKHMYSGREDYIATTTYLVGSEEGQNFVVDPGTYTYTFACPIPINCPSSYEGAYGHIRYLAKVTFIRSGASHRTHNVGFTVLKLLDLNQESTLLKAPANNEALENFCLFDTKAVHLRVDLMQTGYVPGQIILVSVHVNNESSVDCKKLEIKLNLRATYTTDTPAIKTVSEKMCIAQKTAGAILRRSQKDFAETIRVPATPPTCDHLSKVVRVTYEICVTAVMKNLMYDPKTVIPITIGNVPLTNVEYPTTPSVDNIPMTSACAMRLAQANDQGMLTDGTTDEEDEDEIRPDLPPPTYEEAMFMTTDIADDDVNIVSESARFTPRYPVYDVDGMLAANAKIQGPPPNPPQKRRKRRHGNENSMEYEKPPVESPVQI